MPLVFRCAFAVSLVFVNIGTSSAVPICTGPFKSVPNWDPGYVRTMPGWNGGSLKVGDSKNLTAGPYPLPIAVCVDISSPPIDVTMGLNSGGTKKFSLQGSCTIIRTSSVSVSPGCGGAQFPCPSLGANFRYWSKCGSNDRITDVRGWRYELSKPNYPATLVPLTTKGIRGRSPESPADKSYVLVSEHPALLRVCASTNQQIFYSSSIDESNPRVAPAVPGCATIEARTIWVSPLGPRKRENVDSVVMSMSDQ